MCSRFGRISTHVPRAGDDLPLPCGRSNHPGFQPTSPVRETTRKKLPAQRKALNKFQPTSPVRETTKQ